MCALYGRAYDSIRNCSATVHEEVDAPFSIWKIVYPIIKDQCISEDAAAAAVVVHFVRNLIKSLHKSRLSASAVAHALLMLPLLLLLHDWEQLWPCNAMYVQCTMVG